MKGYKEPWQMTQDEFVATNWAERGRPTLEKMKADALAGKLSSVANIDDQVGFLHRLEIQSAVREGKTIPPEVLKEYPTLPTGVKSSAKAATPVPQAVARQPWQMTREEYVKTEPAKYVAVRIGGSNRLLDKQFKAFEQAKIELRDTGQAIGAGHWSNRHAVMPNTPEARALLKSVGGRIAREQPNFYSPSYAHRTEIVKALRENKPIPLEVLWDYPELAAQVKP